MCKSKGMPLTSEQKAAVINLVKAEQQQLSEDNEFNTIDMMLTFDDSESYAVRVAKQLKLQTRLKNIGCKQFVNLYVIPGTSVNCERLFSLAKHELTDTHKTLLLFSLKHCCS